MHKTKSAGIHERQAVIKEVTGNLGPKENTTRPLTTGVRL